MSMANSMKRAVCVLALALAAGLMFATALPATAHAKIKDYTYTVRVWAGNEGTVDGQNSDGYAELTGIKYNTEINLSDEFPAKATNSKYYVKGYRLSGTDNQNTDGSTNLRESVAVTEDMDFVVSYGVKGSQVSYTLHFVERGTNRVLANPITRYGNKGDKPVAAFEYVAGYRPLYRNITGTLGEEGTNDWTFEYVQLREGENESGTTTTTRTTTTTTTPTTTTTTTPTTTPTTTTTTTTTDNTAASPGAANPATNENASASAAAQQPAANEPPATEEIQDIDNPLADGSDNGNANNNTGSNNNVNSVGSQSNQQQDPPYALIFGIALVAVALVGGIMYYMRSRRE